jgi:hypothetical protein
MSHWWLIQAFLDGSHAMADFEADIPKAADQLFQLFLHATLGFLG